MSREVKLALAAFVALALSCLVGGTCLIAAGLLGASTAEPGPGTGEGPPSPALPSGLQPSVILEGERQTWGGYVYVVPPGMTAAAAPDGLLLQRTGQDACTIVLLPLRPAEGALEAQALDLLTRFFAAKYSGYRDPYGGSAPLQFQRKGTTGSGRAFVELPGLTPLDAQGQTVDGLVRALALRVGEQVAGVIGIEGPGRGLDEGADHGHRWLRLLYSLDFPGAPAAARDASPDVVGTWLSASASGAVSETYAADGRFLSGAGFRTTRDVGPTTIEEKTTTWAGEGTWEVHGDLLTVRRAGGKVETNWFRVYSEPNASTPSGWLTTLSKLERSLVDSSVYEIGLRKQ